MSKDAQKLLQNVTKPRNKPFVWLEIYFFLLNWRVFKSIHTEQIYIRGATE